MATKVWALIAVRTKSLPKIPVSQYLSWKMIWRGFFLISVPPHTTTTNVLFEIKPTLSLKTRQGKPRLGVRYVNHAHQTRVVCFLNLDIINEFLPILGCLIPAAFGTEIGVHEDFNDLETMPLLISRAREHVDAAHYRRRNVHIHHVFRQCLVFQLPT